MASDSVIEISGLSKTYGSGDKGTLALNRLDLRVNRGEIFGYLGPNGAGKTTTIRLLLDLIRPSAGSARIFGLDIRNDSVEIHRRIGFLPGELTLWEGRTGRQIIDYVGSVRGDAKGIAKHADELAERLNLDTSKRVRDLSSGNKRKLGLVIAMMHSPELLILDEPTGGLDPLVQQTFHEMMDEYRDKGKTVFLSSHVLSEVQAICDRVGILRDGELKAVESVEKITNVEFHWVDVTFRDAIPAGLPQQLEALPSITDVSTNGARIRMRMLGDFDPLLRAISSGYVETLHVEEPSLEEIFLAFYSGDKES
ncbi:MAG: ABC transporter ATP-binding protein [Chloroflexota bacterium]|nr:ABC transporter ATP-binding protein [Chloroflexota bacterium]MDE2945869.1 ABC transporter ATP-binding protein [Chloroflexota bacterium]